MIFKHKKSLGQNFLKAPHVLEKICYSSELKETDVVLEIGPGKGTLTQKLLEKAGRVVAVEKDNRLIEELSDKFKDLELLNEDILLFNPSDHNLNKGEYKIVANIPYYITGMILEKFLSAENHPKSMTLMVQKEVARRIIATDKKESLLSISVKAYGEPKYIDTVKKELFTPKPKVDSAILHIQNISKDRFLNTNVSESKFFETVKKGFMHKRKKLSNNLETSKEFLESIGLNGDIRAENLSVDDWFEVSKSI
ncbi:MAG: 16S rRNA (adenine1518-N6/adenine1519-N6)-dimethyltransferase [Candidatus Paceibacteria bacterium]|jgi:16S rRNA (adenine1518-N6/adenine1519-N6)-dimethyltransferase